MEGLLLQTLVCVATSIRYVNTIFHGRKYDNFQMIFKKIFLIFAQNIDCGYTLEPPH